jgi:ABC-type glutathione transport system ATPase component
MKLSRYCVLVLFAIVLAFQLGVFLLFKFVSHQKPRTRRITKAPSDGEEEKSPDAVSMEVEEEVTMIGPGDLQMQRDSKPRVTVEFTDVSYLVKGAKSAEDIEDEEKAEALRVEQSLANVKGEEEKAAENKYPCGLAPLVMCLRAREQKSYISLLDGISGRVEPGMMLALMGPSGAGKCMADIEKGEERERGREK